MDRTTDLPGGQPLDNTTPVAGAKPHAINIRRVVGFILWGAGFLLLVVSSVIVHFHPGPWPFDLQTTVTLQHSQISNALNNPVAVVSIVDDPFPSVLIPIIWFVVLGSIGVYVWRMRGWPVRWFVNAIFISAGPGLAAILDFIFSSLVHRPRPSSPLIHIFRSAPTGSFPSGHVENDVVYLGFLLYLSFTKPVSEWRYRWILIPFQIYAVLNILLIGYSRVYEGAHWLTDAAGGYLAGALWLSALIFLYRWTMDTLTKWRERRLNER